MALHISSTLDFDLAQVLVQDLLLQSFLKVTTSLKNVIEDAMLNAFIIKKKKNKLILTDLFS